MVINDVCGGEGRLNQVCSGYVGGICCIFSKKIKGDRIKCSIVLEMCFLRRRANDEERKHA